MTARRQPGPPGPGAVRARAPLMRDIDRRAGSEATAGLVADLRRLGFTEHEARVYLSLLGASPATGYEIAKRTALPRANVYATLENLVSKGAVQPVRSRPTKYTPLPPEQIVSTIKSTVTASCDRLLERLRRLQARADVDYVWSITGAEAVHAKARELIDTARRRVALKSLDTHISAQAAGLRAAAQRGVEVIMVVFGTTEFDFGTTYMHEGTGMPVGAADENLILTVDSEHALIAAIGDEPSGAFTRNRAVVTVAETLVRHDIYLTEIFTKLRPAVEGAFGPALIELRRRLLPAPQVQDLVRRLREVGQLGDWHPRNPRAEGELT